MATKKKKTAASEDQSISWPHKVAGVFAEQLDKAESTTGFTFDEMRKELGLSPGDEGWNDISASMVALRDELGVLVHRFTIKGEPSEVDFQGDPADIPNIQKRKNEKNISQLVFFLSQHAKASMERLDEIVSGDAEFEDIDENPATPILDRDSIAEFYDNVAEKLDDYFTEEEKAAFITYVQVLKPTAG